MSLDNFRKRAIVWDTVNKDFPQPIQAMQGDVNARTVSVKIIDNGGEIDLTGHSLKLTYQYTNSSNSGFVMIPPENLTKGEFLLVIPTEMTKPGVIEANLILLNEYKEQVIVSKKLTFIADESTVTSLAQEVNNKIDDFTKLLLENMPQVMRSELNDLHAQTDSNKSNVELKANLADMTSLQSAMTELKNEVEAFGISPENLVTIKSLLDAIASNASESEVVELINAVKVLTSNISLMSNGDYSPKANQTDLESLQHTVNNQSATVSAKANQTDLDNLKTAVTSQGAEITKQLAQTELKLTKKPNKNETGWATLNTFDESTRAVIQGIKPGEINAVLGEGTVEPFNTNFFKNGTNLYNPATTKSDVYYKADSGNEYPAAGFLGSGFIPVEPNKKYFIRTARHIVFANPDGSYVSGLKDTTGKNEYVVTIPENVRRMRISWNRNDNRLPQQVNKGDKELPYEEYRYYIPSEFIENETGSGQSGVSLKLNLPPEIYAVTGKEVNIYFENEASLPLSDYQVDVTCSLGKQMSNRWTANPTNSGDHPITIDVYKDFEMVAQVNSTVKVKTSDVGSGIEKDAIVVGDSTIAQDFLINHLEDMFETDPLTINFKGTHGTYGELHNEGYAGWTIHDLRTNKTYNDVVNPFYNPIKADFDFAYYMTNQGYTGLDYVVLCFGINDTFSFTNDSTLLNKIPDIIADFNYIINNIHAYDSNIKIGVCVTIPPNASQDAFGNDYYTGQTQWRYKRNNALWIEQLINAFKGKTPQNIYLIPDNSCIDTIIGFRDAVHPNKEVGDKQRADTFYSWFKSFEV